MSVLSALEQDETINSLKMPLAIIRAHNEHLLDTYHQLSPQQALTLLKAIQAQTVLLEHLLDEMTGQLGRSDDGFSNTRSGELL